MKRNMLLFLGLVLLLGVLPGCWTSARYYVVHDSRGRIDTIHEVKQIDGYYVYDVVPTVYRHHHTRIVVRGDRYHWSGRRYVRHVPRHHHRPVVRRVHHHHRPVVRHAPARRHHRPAVHHAPPHRKHRAAVHKGKKKPRPTKKRGHKRRGHRRR